MRYKHLYTGFPQCIYKMAKDKIKTWVNVIPSDGVGGRRTGTGWRVVTGRKMKGKLVSTHSNKKPAIKKAKQYARNHKRRPSIVRVKNTDGRFGQQVTYRKK